MTTTAKNPAATKAFEAKRAEVLAQIEALKAAVLRDDANTVHWGHVGSLSEVATSLTNAMNYA